MRIAAVLLVWMAASYAAAALAGISASLLCASKDSYVLFLLLGYSGSPELGAILSLLTFGRSPCYCSCYNGPLELLEQIVGLSPDTSAADFSIVKKPLQPLRGKDR
jgi:hypothetical protein